MIVLPSEATEPKRVLGLGEVARNNPQLAVALLGGCGDDGCVVRPDAIYGDAACGNDWEMVNISACFTEAAAGKVISGSHPQICNDLHIRRVRVTIRRNNAYAGNVLKSLSDVMNAHNSGIDFTMFVKSYGPNCAIAGEFTPLDNLAVDFECMCPAGLVLRCGGCITTQFLNCRPLACNDPNDPDTENCVGEVPTQVIITLHAIRLPARWGDCTRERAVLALQKLGLLPAA